MKVALEYLYILRGTLQAHIGIGGILLYLIEFLYLLYLYLFYLDLPYYVDSCLLFFAYLSSIFLDLSFLSIVCVNFSFFVIYY